MATKRSGNNRKRRKNAAPATPASVRLAQKGINSSEDFRNLMIGMMTDVIQGNVTPEVVNAACNAGRGLLRMVEIEYRATTSRSMTVSLPISRRIGGASA